jgi:hypothetical protein
MMWGCVVAVASDSALGCITMDDRVLHGYLGRQYLITSVEEQDIEAEINESNSENILLNSQDSPV